MKILRNNFYGKYQNILDSQISEISQRRLSNFQTIVFEKLTNQIRKKLELEQNMFELGVRKKLAPGATEPMTGYEHLEAKGEDLEELVTEGEVGLHPAKDPR